MERFTNKVVLVTGAASGIGLATARAFAAEGARVVLADKSQQALTAAVDEIRTVGGVASGIHIDVTNPADCEAMVRFAVATYGTLNVAFNNAGIAPSIAPDFESQSLEDWDRVVRTNISGMFYAMKAEVPALRAAGGGAIVNTASVMTFLGGAGMAAYVASKHAVAGLTKSTALDLIRYGIRVNAICPGIIDTPILKDIPHGGREAMEGMIPIHRFGTAEEVAKAVLFLASEDASYAIGSLMLLDGGVSLP
jgi:NAD(P)-dependent dehydrogenase (short-subunit alcohol dehydrogenase family)